MRILLLAALAASALALAAASGGTAFEVVNDSSHNLVRLMVGRRQMLDGPVAPGQSVTVDAGACQVTVVAVYDDGSRTVGQVNACQAAQYPSTARGIPICPGDARCKGQT